MRPCWIQPLVHGHPGHDDRDSAVRGDRRRPLFMVPRQRHGRQLAKTKRSGTRWWNFTITCGQSGRRARSHHTCVICRISYNGKWELRWEVCPGCGWSTAWTDHEAARAERYLPKTGCLPPRLDPPRHVLARERHQWLAARVSPLRRPVHPAHDRGGPRIR